MTGSTAHDIAAIIAFVMVAAAGIAWVARPRKPKIPPSGAGGRNGPRHDNTD